MKSGRNHKGDGGGFTIVETLIVLAVTSALLISALALVSGSQNKTQFSQAINDIDQQIQNVINNVSNGYYNNTIGNMSCTAPATNDPPRFTPGAVPQGSNTGCIYIGRAIQFTDSSEFYIHNIIGRQRTPGGDEVTTMVEAQAQVLEPGDNTHNSGSDIYPSTTDTKTLKNGLVPGYMGYYETGGTWQSVPGVTFTSTLGTIVSGNMESGAQTIDVAPTYFQPPIGLSSSKAQFVDAFNGGASYSLANAFAGQFPNNKNPSKGVIICFNSATTNQRGIIVIGGDSRLNSTQLTIEKGQCGAQP